MTFTTILTSVFLALSPNVELAQACPFQPDGCAEGQIYDAETGGCADVVMS